MGIHGTERMRGGANPDFTRNLLEDLEALEHLLHTGAFETGRRRVGAEQELFLVDRNMRPAPLAMEVIARAADPRLVTEIALFNLEANLTPRDPAGDGLVQIERELDGVIDLARRAAREMDLDVVLSGILPTLRHEDLSVANLTPLPRYLEMARAVSELRGSAFHVFIRGLDELELTHDSVMLEAANTSFQVHYQVAPGEFVDTYNAAQLVCAPVLAAAVNSPLVFGKRLWHETRPALFEHAVDERSDVLRSRARPPRVTFGDRWVDSSVLEIYRDQVARYRSIVSVARGEDPREVLARGGVPPLTALCLHNGTIWRWNRPCYGVLDGKPHLRIENRSLPAGPTVRDEMANAALLVGLLAAIPAEYGPVHRRMSWDDVHANFYAAARHGLKAQLTWPALGSVPVTTLIRKHLLPLARRGLEQLSVSSTWIDRYLGVIEERVESGRTGAQWSLSSLEAMRGRGTAELRHRSLVSGMLRLQKQGDPVHGWPVAVLDESRIATGSFRTVGQFMSTDLVTVRAQDPLELAASVMVWRGIRHVPVEDDQGFLGGMVTYREVLQAAAAPREAGTVTVESVMQRAPLTVTRDTSTLDAMDRMRATGTDAVVVVDEGRLIGILTAQDLLEVSIKLFEEALRSEERSLRPHSGL